MNAAALTALQIIAFLGIGLLFSLVLAKRKIIQSHFILICAYAISCLVGYLLFFVYAYNPWYGTVSTGLYYLFGVICFSAFVFAVGKDAPTRRLFISDVFPPLLLILIVCTFYSATTFSCTARSTPANDPYNVYQSCMLSHSPGDNILAEYFGDKLIENQDGALAADWHLADRPPLQLGNVISLLDTVPDNVTKFASYQIFSTFLQLGWIAGLWALLRSMKVKRANQNFVLFLSVFTGFYYVNSVYVWPKLLAAGFMISTVALLIYNNPSRLQKPKTAYYEWTFVSALLALSLLAHGSVLFTIIPLAIFVLYRRKLPPLSVLICASIVAAILYAPWMLYQAHTTQSDRLVKWHFAGVIKVDDRSTLQTIKQSYSSLTLSEWLSGRAQNVEALFKPSSEQAYMHVFVDEDTHDDSVLDKIRRQEYFSTFWAFSILNIGWIAAIFVRKRDKKLFDNIKPLAILGLASLFVWCLLMFIPGTTYNHQGSYATSMILLTFLILAISGISKVLQAIIALLQVSLFLAAWVFLALYQNQQSLGLAFLLNLLGVFVIFISVYYKEISPKFKGRKSG